jgi:hypothetical protein
MSNQNRNEHVTRPDIAHLRGLLDSAELRGEYRVSIPATLLKALVDAAERDLDNTIVVSHREVP